MQRGTNGGVFVSEVKRNGFGKSSQMSKSVKELDIIRLSVVLF